MQTSTHASSPNEIVVISHSPIFYWWPVWFVGFLMAAWTYFDGHLMAIVPVGNVAEEARTAGTNAQQFEVVNVLRIRRKLALIQQMLKERAVVGGAP